MSDIRQLSTIEEWNEALRGSSERPLLVFKHSTSCSVSAGAHEDFVHYVKDKEGNEVDFALVRVIEERPVSNAIAEELGVKHASPQAILVKDGEQVWNTSHWNITYSFLSEKLGKPVSQES
jgi:bacillithiol system protein YtxJ